MCHKRVGANKKFEVAGLPSLTDLYLHKWVTGKNNCQ